VYLLNCIWYVLVVEDEVVSAAGGCTSAVLGRTNNSYNNYDPIKYSNTAWSSGQLWWASRQSNPECFTSLSRGGASGTGRYCWCRVSGRWCECVSIDRSSTCSISGTCIVCSWFRCSRPCRSTSAFWRCRNVNTSGTSVVVWVGVILYSIRDISWTRSSSRSPSGSHCNSSGSYSRWSVSS